MGVTVVGGGEGRGGRGRGGAPGVRRSSDGDGLGSSCRAVMPSPRAHIGTRPQSLDAGDARTPRGASLRARETADGCAPLSCSFPAHMHHDYILTLFGL